MRTHVFAAGVKFTSYVAVISAGAVPVPTPQAYVTVYVFAFHFAVNVLSAVYCHLNAVPTDLTSDVPDTVHPSNVYPVRTHVFAAGVKFTSYVAVVSAGAVPVPSPQAYVTVYSFAVQHAYSCVFATLSHARVDDSTSLLFAVAPTYCVPLQFAWS